jgi:hypothetical protein
MSRWLILTIVAWLLSIGGVLLPKGVAARGAMVPHEVAVLRLLDKATARVEQAELRLNQPYHFGALAVELRSCQQAPPEDEPEAAAFLVATAMNPNSKQAELLFRGWMFASNPALSALEHPLYDVWVIGCKNPIAPPPNATSLNAPLSNVGVPPISATEPAPALPVAVPGYVPAMQPPLQPAVVPPAPAASPKAAPP